MNSAPASTAVDPAARPRRGLGRARAGHEAPDQRHDLPARLEPDQRQARIPPAARTRRHAGRRRALAVGSNTLDAAFGLEAGDTLGLVCDRKTGLAGAIGNLANHCMLADPGRRRRLLRQPPGQRRRQPRPPRRQGRPGRWARGRDTLPAWLSPNSKRQQGRPEHPDRLRPEEHRPRGDGVDRRHLGAGAPDSGRRRPPRWPTAGAARASPSAPVWAISAPTSSAASSTSPASRANGKAWASA